MPSHFASIASLLALLPLTLALPTSPIDRQLVARSKSASHSLPIAAYSAPITRKVARSGAKQDALKHYRERAATHSSIGTGANESTLSGPYGGEEYAIDIIIGNQSFSVILDTGSSDLWVPLVNYTCISLEGDLETEAECSFGPNLYNPSLSKTVKPFDGYANFNITYGDGEFLTGVPAYETVTVANLTVKDQLFSIVDVAAWNGDNITDGLLGLASPFLTSVFIGEDPAEDNFLVNQYIYDPWFYSAVKQNVTSPVFSIALNRPTLKQEAALNDLDPFGYIAFGGVPAQVNVTKKTVTVPDLSFKVDVDGKNYTAPLYYTIPVDNYVFKGSKKIAHGTNDTTTILDSGSTLLYLRDDISAAVNALFDPPAIYNSTEGAYDVPCNATAPSLGVTIGGETFNFNSSDLIFFSETVDGVDYCISSIVDGGPAGSIFILGDRFLVNVVATFDIGNSNITLSERHY